MDIMKDFVSQLQSALDDGRVTVAVLAEKSKCSRQCVYNVLKRSKKPSLELAGKLARAAGFRVVIERSKISA